MTDFVEIPGASGAPYRFRSADPDALPPTAGNVVVASGAGARLKVVFCGAARSLSEFAPTLSNHLAAQRGARLYIRLNVARATREAEHADLVAGLGPEVEASTLG